MRFGMLGSVAVVADDGAPIEIRGAQPRLVLAVLLVAAGRPVSPDAIIDVVWGDDPPASAAGTLQTYISRLRRQLEPERAARSASSVLLSEPGGYRLALEHHHLDAREFEALADRGATLLGTGHHAEAAEVLRQAETLWRGPALAEYRDEEFARGLAARLDDRRSAALVDRLHCDLALGHHAAIIGELTELVDAQPLQEDFRAQLALALYRSGRQSEALRSLDRARRTLRDELGVEPGRPLRELEAAILAHDPALDLAPPGAPATQLGPAATPPDPPADPPAHLIGRAAELAELRAAFEEAASATRSVIVEGEAGIGKTRLIEELCREAVAAGAAALWGRAFEGGAAPAFWPWLPPLRELVGPDPRDLSPELSSVLFPAAQHDGAAMEMHRFALVDAVAALLEERTSTQRLVLVIDDVQWADAASLELLTALAGRLRDAPLLVIAAVRELDVGRNDALVDALAALTRQSGSRRLPLRGLNATGTEQLVAQTTGTTVDHEVARTIHRRAEGNPFFATQLARLLETGDALTDIPSGVRDVVRRRLALLPDSCNELLEVAAVIGRDVDLDLLARSAGRDLGSCIDDLEPAVVQRLLVAVPELPGVHRFAHALVREVVADGLSTLRQARLHLQIADACDDSDDTAEIRAGHLWEAVSLGVGRRAADDLERAARVAMRRTAYGPAIQLLERAVSLRRTQNDPAAELETVRLLLSVLAARNGQAYLLGSPLLARGLELAELLDAGDEKLQFLWWEWAGYDTACMLGRADPLATELMVRAERSDLPIAPVIANTAYGISCWHNGRITEAATHLDRAAEAVLTLPEGWTTSSLLDIDQIRLSLPFAAYVTELAGTSTDPSLRYEELVRMLPGQNYWELVVMTFAAAAGVVTGAFERAIADAERGIAADPEGMSAFWSMSCRAYRGVALCAIGDLDRGLEVFDGAWKRYTEMGSWTNGPMLLNERALALVLAGRDEEAARALDDAQALLDATGERYAESVLRFARAAAALRAGAPATEVAAGFDDAVSLAVAQGANGIARRLERQRATLLQRA